MKTSASDIVSRRLKSQRLVAPRHTTPADVVRWSCAVQAQDFAGSLWGIGQRTTSSTERDVERAIAERAIVRTWPMRGTLHFVAPEDIRWMTATLATRMMSRAAGRHRELGLDEKSFTKSRNILERALSRGALSRPDAYRVLERGGVAPTGQRGIHILGVLAMRGVICFGSRSGKQPTFVLLDDWIPKSRKLEGDEALGELARRYFESHGPATITDFAWWTGLPLGLARRAVDIAGPTEHAPARNVRGAILLPAYDEYTVAYRDRSAFLDASLAERTKNGIFSPVVTIDGRIAGTWRRETKRDHVRLTTDLATRPSATTRAALKIAAKRYASFIELPVTLDGDRT